MLLHDLAGQLTTRQLEARETGFAQMRALINAAPSEGVCAEFSRSRTQPPEQDGVRVDIEVRAGQALTN